MKIVGLAGPAGSGKSTLGELLARRPGYARVDCDELAWEAYRPGGPAYEGLRARFGPAVLNPDGTVHRQTLARLALTDPQAKKDLEDLVHPAVMARVTKLAQEHRARGTRVLVVEGALLLSSPHVDPEFFDLVVWLEVPEEERRRRLAAAGIPPETVEARMAAQNDLRPSPHPKLVVLDGQDRPAALVDRIVELLGATW